MIDGYSYSCNLQQKQALLECSFYFPLFTDPDIYFLVLVAAVVKANANANANGGG